MGLRTADFDEIPRISTKKDMRTRGRGGCGQALLVAHRVQCVSRDNTRARAHGCGAHHTVHVEQSTRSLGPFCGRNVTGIRRKRTSYLPCNDSIVQGSVEK